MKEIFIVVLYNKKTGLHLSMTFETKERAERFIDRNKKNDILTNKKSIWEYRLSVVFI